MLDLVNCARGLLYRKKKILSLKLRGKKNWEISEKLGYSLSTIEKDLHEIRQFIGGILKW